jgi:hypothetical protein
MLPAVPPTSPRRWVLLTTLGSLGLVLAFFLPVVTSGRNASAALSVLDSLGNILSGELRRAGTDIVTILVLGAIPLTGVVFLLGARARSRSACRRLLWPGRGVVAVFFIGYAILGVVEGSSGRALFSLIGFSLAIIIFGTVILPGWRRRPTPETALRRYQIVGALLCAAFWGFTLFTLVSGRNQVSIGAPAGLLSSLLLLAGGIRRPTGVE